MTKSIDRRRLLLLLAATLPCSACTRVTEATSTTSAADDSEYFLTILLDFSGSFEEKMLNDGKAYEFCLAVLDKYFSDRSGVSDTIVLAQISGANKTLLWQGSPLEMRRTFLSPDNFRDYIKQRADSNGSPVYRAVRSCIRYVMSEPRVQNGKAKACLLVLSDLLDNDVDRKESGKRMLEALTEFGKAGHVLGLYFVDQEVLPGWRKWLSEKSGIRDFRVESEIVDNPTLPEFD